MFATDYFVTPTGNASDPDCSGGGAPSCAGAWDASDFNAAGNWSDSEDANKIDPGDTVYFAGDFILSGPLRFPKNGTAGNYITLDGYYANDTTFADLSEADGRAKLTRTQSNSTYIFDLAYANLVTGTGSEYFIIQDFEIEQFSHAIVGSNGANHIIIRRNYIHDGQDFGIWCSYYTAGVDNFTVGGAPGQGNVVKNVGSGTAGGDIVFSRAHDIIISYNHLYATLSDGASTDRGIDGIVPINNTYNVLIEYNSIHGHNDNYGPVGEDGIDIKTDLGGDGAGCYNIIIRYNDIYDHQKQSTITLQTQTRNVYIYGNRLASGNWGGVVIDEADCGAPSANPSGCSEMVKDIWIFSNLIYDQQDTGIVIRDSPYGIEDGLLEPWNIYIYNNTFADNATGTHIGWNFNNITAVDYDEDSLVVKNNIFYQWRSGYDSDLDHANYFEDDITDPTDVDYNVYWMPGEASGYSEIYIAGSWQSAIDGGHGAEGNSFEGDPGLTSLATNNYSILSSASAVYGTGVDMGDGATPIITITIQGVEYPVYRDIALGPNTVWTAGEIPDVEILRRDTVGWDIGAYAGTGFDITFSYPASLRGCTSDPRTVQIGATTSSAADCRVSVVGEDTCETAYADLDTLMTDDGSEVQHAMAPGPSLACDGTYYYVIKCEEDTTDMISSCAEVTIQISAAEGSPQPTPVSRVQGGNVRVVQGGNVKN